MSGRVLATKVMKSITKLQKYQVLSMNQVQELLKKIMKGDEIRTVEDVEYALYAYDIPDGKEEIFVSVINELKLQGGIKNAGNNII